MNHVIFFHYLQEDGLITSHHPLQYFICVSAVCCTSMCPWVASARHWDHKEHYLASTGGGGGGKHMCGVPPQITQRWLFSVEDRYGHSIMYALFTLLHLRLWTLIAPVAVLQPEYCLSKLEMK